MRNNVTGRAGTTAISRSPPVLPLFAAAYRAFGDYQFSDPFSLGSAAIRHRASTKEEESQLGLLNEGFRYRDIRTGVFLSRDSAGFVDGPNLSSTRMCRRILGLRSIPMGCSTKRN